MSCITMPTKQIWHLCLSLHCKEAINCIINSQSYPASSSSCNVLLQLTGNLKCSTLLSKDYSKSAYWSCGVAASYGDRAQDITRIAEQRKLGRRLVRGHPVLEAEVVYAVHHEYCESPEDFIARRSRLAFLDHRACEEALPRVHRLACLPYTSPFL